MKVTAEVRSDLGTIDPFLCQFLVSLVLPNSCFSLESQLKSGEIYRGTLLSAEDTMNLSLSDVLRTARNGQISKLPSVYLRGSSIRFIALPDVLKKAPVFQKVAMMKRKMEQTQQDRKQQQPGDKRKRGD